MLGVPEESRALSATASLGSTRREHQLQLPLVMLGIVLGTSLYVFQIETGDRHRLAAARLGSAGSSRHIRSSPCPGGQARHAASLAGFDRTIEEAAQKPRRRPRRPSPARHLCRASAPASPPRALFGFATPFGNLEMSLFQA